MGKRQRGNSISLDSFLDIMTCLVGLLVLIIILTALDASQVRVVIPTPIDERDTTGKFKPIYIECRNDQLFLVPVAELREMANSKLKEITQQASGNTVELLRLINENRIQTDVYEVELTYALLGEMAVRPIPASRGYELPSYDKEGPEGWLGKIVTAMDKEAEIIVFLVRDQSFRVFRHARALAWVQNARVSYELLSEDEPIKFGLLGPRAAP